MTVCEPQTSYFNAASVWETSFGMPKTPVNTPSAFPNIGLDRLNLRSIAGFLQWIADTFRAVALAFAHGFL